MNQGLYFVTTDPSSPFTPSHHSHDDYGESDDEGFFVAEIQRQHQQQQKIAKSDFDYGASDDEALFEGEAQQQHQQRQKIRGSDLDYGASDDETLFTADFITKFIDDLPFRILIKKEKINQTTSPSPPHNNGRKVKAPGELKKRRSHRTWWIPVIILWIFWFATPNQSYSKFIPYDIRLYNQYIQQLSFWTSGFNLYEKSWIAFELNSSTAVHILSYQLRIIRNRLE